MLYATGISVPVSLLLYSISIIVLGGDIVVSKRSQHIPGENHSTCGPNFGGHLGLPARGPDKRQSPLPHLPSNLLAASTDPSLASTSSASPRNLCSVNKPFSYMSWGD